MREEYNQAGIDALANAGRPIPGQSLTSTPKGAPYERPPEIVELQDVVKLHMENFNK